MLILELITSLMLWIAIFLPINSYLLGISDRSPNKLIQDVSNQTIFDVTKIAEESLMNRNDLCDGLASDSTSSRPSSPSFPPSSSPISPKTYNLLMQNIPVKSTSSEATGIISDGENLFVSLNSASTTDYDLVAYNYNDISKPLDQIDSGPGILGLTIIGQNLFAINSSINSAVQRFKFDSYSNRINKIADYKIPWSSSNNPIYVTKISAIYPHLFIGLKKNSSQELLSVDFNKIDQGLQSAINNKWEFDSSIQALWPMYDKYLHLLISTAKEPEINDICLNCNSSSTLDLAGSLGNVRSLISKDNSIFVGRTAGNNELFKIKMIRDYSSSTLPKIIYDVVNAIDVNEGIYSMLVSDSNLFLVAGRTNSKIQIRDINDITKVIQEINTITSISDLECVGDRVFGVGSNTKMNGTSTESITPVIFELKNETPK